MFLPFSQSLLVFKRLEDIRNDIVVLSMEMFHSGVSWEEISLREERDDSNMQKEDHTRGKRAESNESKKGRERSLFLCVRLGHYTHIAQSHSSVR